ncbi:DUF397 domain-containing protein [Nocardiopsis coralliicola]
MSNWHTSSYSANGGECVEVREGVLTLVRDTKHRHLGHVEFTSGEWHAFLEALKHGRL